MPLTDYLALGGVEIVNHVRLAQYLTSVGSPLDSVANCVCPTLTPEMLGDLDYTTPEADGAPWYDPDVPDSAKFIGLMVLTVDGLDEYPVRRSVTNAITGGGVIGPARAIPRTITVTGILLGVTCCAVEYGLHWLSEALTGCVGQSCSGDCMTLYACCPDEEMTEECFNEQHRRTLRNVALVEGPRVIERQGNGCGSGTCAATGADILTVEFILTAGSPWLWTDPFPIVEMVPPRDDSDTCITWCLPGGATSSDSLCVDVSEGSCDSGAVQAAVTDGACAGGVAWTVHETTCEDGCRFKPCEEESDQLVSPYCPVPAPPVPTSSLETCYCLPLADERQCCNIDLSECPAWSVDALQIIVRAGSSEIRNLTVAIYERLPGHETMTCEEVADDQRCDPLTSFTIGYVPAGGALTIDGQTGRATVEYGQTCETSRDVYGTNGGPISFPDLTCSSYVMCLSTDVQYPPAADSLVTINVSGKGF